MPRTAWIACRLSIALLVVLAYLWPAPARAEAPEESRYRIELLTVGPGDAFFTRAGHAALVVVEIWPDGREMSTVYNYGDADFADPWLGPRFLFGQNYFFVSVSGDLFESVEHYGLNMNRDVYGQRLALTDAQAASMARKLALAVLPENREYPYHYLDRTCTTELRTLLNDELGGTIAEQLSETDPWTVRKYQQLTFDGDIVVALLGDAIFGRMHDAPVDRYFAMMWPRRMREYLQLVQVPDPSGGDGLVPLASEPVVLAERGGPPATVSPNRISWYFVPIASLLVLLASAVLAPRGPSRLAGAWLLAWSLPIGVVGLVITVLSVASTVPEMGSNELVLSLLVTDLALVGPAVAWLRGRVGVPRWLPRYATARLVVVAAAIAARGTGLFIQEPWVIPVGSLVVSVALWWFVRRVKTAATAST